jgi:hypothetical protein
MTTSRLANAAIAAVEAARQAELGDLLDSFPNDVAVAAHTAGQLRAILNLPDDPAAEPWPPMRIKAYP